MTNWDVLIPGGRWVDVQAEYCEIRHGALRFFNGLGISEIVDAFSPGNWIRVQKREEPK